MPHRPASGHSRCGTVKKRFTTGCKRHRSATVTAMASALILSLIAAAAIAQSAPAPSGARAEATARATIISPARLRIAKDGRTAQVELRGPIATITPRATERPCPADAAPPCPAIVYDLP
jgi:hypothetical protein